MKSEAYQSLWALGILSIVYNPQIKYYNYIVLGRFRFFIGSGMYL